MNDMTWFTLLSTVVGLAAITLGRDFPRTCHGTRHQLRRWTRWRDNPRQKNPSRARCSLAWR